MNKFKDEEKYTTLEQSKILEPIMDKLGMESWAYWVDKPGNAVQYPCGEYYSQSQGTMLQTMDNYCKAEEILTYKKDKDYDVFSYSIQNCELEDAIPAWTLDTLLWVLPDWLILDMTFNKGSKAIAAATELIKLLDDNDLLKEVKND